MRPARIEPAACGLKGRRLCAEVETLVKVAAATGLEFAIDIAPLGQEPKLVGKALRDTPAHIYAGASLLVAGA